MRSAYNNDALSKQKLGCSKAAFKVRWKLMYLAQKNAQPLQKDSDRIKRGDIEPRQTPASWKKSGSKWLRLRVSTLFRRLQKARKSELVQKASSKDLFTTTC